MIQANELRIGNKILCDGKMATVANLFPDNIRVKEKSIYEQASHESMYEPIPLTPEILEKAGFVQHLEIKQLYFLKEFRYNAKLNKLKLLRPCNSAGESQQHVCGIGFLTDDLDIKHLHQLQNLYFTLTGTELEINL